MLRTVRFVVAQVIFLLALVVMFVAEWIGGKEFRTKISNPAFMNRGKLAERERCRKR